MKDQQIGLIGLGSMGSEMALKFLAAGYDLTVYDIKAERLLPSVSAGATEAGSAADLAKKVDLVMTSLRDSAIWVSVTETELLPHAKLGQTFIDFGTTVVQQTQQLAEALTTKEATLLDVPVSGGPVGIRNGNLHMFAGGCREELDRCLPLLSVIGDPKRIVYCGPSGSGQVVKGLTSWRWDWVPPSTWRQLLLVLVAESRSEPFAKLLVEQQGGDGISNRLPTEFRKTKATMSMSSILNCITFSTKPSNEGTKSH